MHVKVSPQVRLTRLPSTFIAKNQHFPRPNKPASKRSRPKSTNYRKPSGELLPFTNQIQHQHPAARAKTRRKLSRGTLSSSIGTTRPRTLHRCVLLTASSIDRRSLIQKLGCADPHRSGLPADDPRATRATTTGQVWLANVPGPSPLQYVYSRYSEAVF